MNEPLAATSAPGALDTLYGAMFRPKPTFEAAPVPMRAAALVVLVVALVWAFDLSSGHPELLPLALFTALGWMTFGWLALAAGVFLAVRALYRRGDFQPICAAVGLGLAPWILLGPIEVLSRLGPRGTALAAIAGLVVFVWWLRLLVLGVRGATGLTGGQAVLVLAATELAAVALPFAWLVLWTLALGLGIARSV